MSEFCQINPSESIAKGTVAKRVAMDFIQPFTKRVSRYSLEQYNGGIKFKNGDTLLARITPSLVNGKTSFVDFLDEDEVGFGSTEFIVLREKEGISDKHFLYYLTISNDLRETAIISMTGTSGRQRVETDVIKHYEFSSPPLPEQKAIAEVLSSLDDKIDLLHRQNKTLEDMAQALFRKWFVEEADEGWEEKMIGNVLEVKLGGTPLTSNPDYWHGNIPWINSSELNEFRILKPAKYITKLGLEKSATKLLPKGTTVIAITGATLGQMSLLEIDSCANQSVVGIIPNEKFPREFVYLWIKGIIGILVSNQTGGAQQHINKMDISNACIISPPAEFIENKTSILKDYFDKISINSLQINTLENLRDTLLPKLMNGNVRVGN